MNFQIIVNNDSRAHLIVIIDIVELFYYRIIYKSFIQFKITDDKIYIIPQYILKLFDDDESVNITMVVMIFLRY